MRLSGRVNRIKPSPTLAVDARAKELKAQGKDVISLGAGEPDFDTPEHVKEAAVRAIRDGFTKYTAVDGTPGLKQAVIAKFRRDNGLDYTPEEILVSVGGKHSFFNLAQALLDNGDEVIIPAPYWVSYPDMVLLADASPIVVSAGIDQAFKIRPDQLERTITRQTRLLVINSPSNPTGAVYTRAELATLGEVLRKQPHVLIATDDMYEHILWSNEPFCNILNVCPDLKERTIVLNGVSKVYAMTGWRIGYAAGPKSLIAAMKKIQSQSTSNPTSIAQVAAEAALNGDQGCIAPMVRAFKERHDRVVSRLNKIRGVRCLPSQGTFYAFPDFSKAIAATAGMGNDVEMAEYILNKGEVALVPGSAFGAEGHLRLSYATSMDTLEKALDRIGKLLGTN
ncbi:pyridoxal phosphate-dependent aminotransferase [Sulfuricaulis sp.]|uniref:pyridoxal phosphate-dependent aminotransferase n=1 Tax=Sulfuricaulis sp. TaxID=2003553 RepID=UPI00355A402A